MGKHGKDTKPVGFTWQKLYVEELEKAAEDSGFEHTATYARAVFNWWRKNRPPVTAYEQEKQKNSKSNIK